MHWAILRQALGENPVPEPFISGDLVRDQLRPTVLGRSNDGYEWNAQLRNGEEADAL